MKGGLESNSNRIDDSAGVAVVRSSSVLAVSASHGAKRSDCPSGLQVSSPESGSAVSKRLAFALRVRGQDDRLFVDGECQAAFHRATKPAWLVVRRSSPVRGSTRSLDLRRGLTSSVAHTRSDRRD